MWICGFVLRRTVAGLESLCHWRTYETARLRVGATAVVQAAEVAKVTRSTLVLRVWSREDPFILDVHKS